MSNFNLSSINVESGKIAIVTGANIGLGFETAKGLASKGIEVVLACRNTQKADEAIRAILQSHPQAKLHNITIDLNSLTSVRKFADEIIQKFNRLDLLINNAGIMFPPFAKTAEGFESQMGVNYFSHFVLTMKLLPLLHSTKEARVVTLSSIAHKQGDIDFNNLNSEKSYSKMKAYGQSKLACLMFAFELNRRLQAAGSPVLSLAAHPGVSNTNLFQHVTGFMKTLFNIFTPLFSHSPANAALPTLLAALDNNVKGGAYYGPTGLNEMKGPAGKAFATNRAQNEALAKKLWEVSVQLTNTSMPELK